MDNSKATHTVSKKTKMTSVNPGGNRVDTEYDEAEVEIEFSNISKDLKEFIIKTTKDAISIFFIKKLFLIQQLISI